MATTRWRQIPIPTAGTLGVLAAVLWLNAAVNHFRFNVALALLGSVPLLIVFAVALTRRPRPTP